MNLWRYGYEIEQLGQRYHLEGLLGSGGMADVFLAWDERKSREVAIKVIKMDNLEQETLNRFIREASQIARWNHPYIIHVYDEVKLEILNVDQGLMIPYIVMEYVQGGDLSKRLTPNQPYPLAETLKIIAHLCSAVQFAHEHNVIHRDLKPANILFRQLHDGSEVAVLSDFGLAVQVDASHHTFAHGGTLAYMAPEQFQGQSKRASDIFALGVIFYQLVTGRLPFPRSLRTFQLVEPFELPLVPSLVNKALPKALDNVILKALSEEPAQRYVSAALLWQAIRAAIASKSPQLVTRRLKEIEGETRSTTNTPMVGPGNSLANAQVSRLEALERVILSNEDKNPAAPVVPGALDIKSTVQNQTPNAEAVLPANKNARNKSPAGTLQLRNGRRLLLTSILMLCLLLLVFGSAIYAASDILGWGPFAGIFPVTALSSVVTITPKSAVLQNSYEFMAVMGKPDPSQQQVQARQISSTASDEKTVPVTGFRHFAATKATGILTFVNTSTNPITIGGLIITGSDGVQVTFSGPVTVPANPPTATVNAYAVTPGAKGNISAYDIDGTCCVASNQVFVKNTTAFTGGQDAQDGTYVQQSDISGVSNSLGPLESQHAQSGLKNLLSANERFVGSPQCPSQPRITTDHNGGDKAGNVTVRVSVTCTQDAYDRQAAQSMAITLFMREANQKLDPHYTLKGGILTTASASQINDTIALSEMVKGVWVYRISNSSSFARLIAGKTKAAALSTLRNLPCRCVEGVSTNLPDRVTNLPTNPNRITIKIADVPGFPGSLNSTSTAAGRRLEPMIE